MSLREVRSSPIENWLDQYGRRELLRFLTCGSVDDGKSTLIGRLLHDSHMVYEDQLSAARRDSTRHGTTGGELDLALLVDGLQAEREQGITIDVAYRYFATARRKFIIADTPGHEQYTRNMATGASNCDLAVILVDATRGVLDQTRRHAFIATLLGIKHVVVAVNKMDLAAYDQRVFERIRDDFAGFAAKLDVSDIQFIPISALHGDNVVHDSDRMRWYAGAPLLHYLESVHIASDRNLIDLRFPVQLVQRPNAQFRGYAGTIASGVLSRGDAVTVLPSGRRTHIRSIITIDGERDSAFAPMPVTVTLTDEVDASRGDMFVHPNNAPRVEREFEAMLVWMHEEAVRTRSEYILKQTTVSAPVVIREIRYRMNVNTLHRESCDELRLNEIGRVRVETPRMIAFDSYQRNRATGAFILIDRITNATVGAGMILDRDPDQVVLPHLRGSEDAPGPRPADWSKRLGQLPISIRVTANAADRLARQLRQLLFEHGFLSEIVSDQLGPISEIEALLRSVGTITIAAGTADHPDARIDVASDARKESWRMMADPEAIYTALVEAGFLQRIR